MRDAYRVAQQRENILTCRCAVHVSQQALQDLERAHVNSFEKRVFFLGLMREGGGDSFQFT